MHAPTRLLLSALVASLLLPAAAGAHGLGEGAVGRSVLEFVPFGMEHMLLGWDHLLFIIGAVLLAGSTGRAIKVVSLFAAGHSLTLIVATLAGWRLDATLVDVVIALSVAWVGIVGLRGRPERWTPVFGTVFAFGLVHGLGLATRLQDAGLERDGVLAKVLAFNVGLEVGQVLALLLVAAVGRAVVARIPPPAVAGRVAAGALIVTGLVAAAVLSFSAAEEGADPERAAAPSASPGEGCEEAEATPPAFAGGGHPDKRFFAPGEEVDVVDLVHVITDGYVVVRYRAGLPEPDREAIRELTDRGKAVIAVPDDEQEEALHVVASRRELRCATPDVDSAAAFSERWLADVQSGLVRP